MSTPKTPARTRSRSDAANLIQNFSSLNLSPTKAAKPSPNPFLTATTPKKPVVNDSLHRQAQEGIAKKGGLESRLNVVKIVPPQQQPPPQIKRSKSTSSVNRDRFITTRDEAAPSLDQAIPSRPSSPGHTTRLAEATGVNLNRRILGYHEQPPAASSDATLNPAREYARPLLRPASLPTSTGAQTNKSRKIPTQPERILDAPGMVDDFYLNLISWSKMNMLAVALESSTYIWNADSGSVAQLGNGAEGTYVSSLDFSNDGMFIGLGTGEGDVELWDVETGAKLRTMSGRQGQVASLSWNEHILSSGCGDGSIWHHDVRVPRHKVMELLGHTGEICGLKWRSDGELIASGGNDNVVNIWDGRVGDVVEGARGTAKWTKRNHTAAVKALSWCSWQPSLLASGGGTNDATINVWNSTTGARLHTVTTPSQVTSLNWSPHRKELISTHGYPTNSLMIHAYPSMEQVAEIRDAHDSRVLFSALSPAGDVLCTGAGDDVLKFWRVWEKEAIVKKKKEVKETSRSMMGTGLATGRSGSTKTGALAIR